MLVRVQGPFPATGEALAPFNIGHFVAGIYERKSQWSVNAYHYELTGFILLMGHQLYAPLGFCVHKAKFTEPADAFDHPYWDYIRTKVSRKATDIREQGFAGPAMLPYSELEYGGIVKKMEKLEPRFKVKKETKAKRRNRLFLRNRVLTTLSVAGYRYQL